MAPTTSAFSRTRSIRLTRNKSYQEQRLQPNVNPITGEPMDDDGEAPLLRTTFTDLKNRPDARQVLRMQFSSTFSEDNKSATTPLSPSSQHRVQQPLSAGLASPLSGAPLSPSAGAAAGLETKGFTAQPESALRGRMPRSQTAPTLLTQDTLPTIVEPKRLSIVPEGPSQMDVEQAISLLEQLKKTASPEQLVALHRALLPTKDVITPVTPMFPADALEIPASASTSSSATTLTGPEPPMRKSALLMPGLATRATDSAADSDVLRKPNDFLLKPVPAKARRRGRKSSLSGRTLDSPLYSPELPRFSAVTAAGRSDTPDLIYTQPGAFQYGTLRITNGGAVSPEPPLHSPASVDTAMTPETPEDPFAPGSGPNSKNSSTTRLPLSSDLGLESDLDGIPPPPPQHATYPKPISPQRSVSPIGAHTSTSYNETSESPQISPLQSTSPRELHDLPAAAPSPTAASVASGGGLAMTTLYRTTTNESRGPNTPLSPMSISTLGDSVDGATDACEVVYSRLARESRPIMIERRPTLLVKGDAGRGGAMPPVAERSASEVAAEKVEPKSLAVESLLKEKASVRTLGVDGLAAAAETPSRSFEDLLPKLKQEQQPQRPQLNVQPIRSQTDPQGSRSSPAITANKRQGSLDDYAKQRAAGIAQSPEPQEDINARTTRRKLQKQMPPNVRKQSKDDGGSVSPAEKDSSRRSPQSTRVYVNGAEVEMVAGEPPLGADRAGHSKSQASVSSKVTRDDDTKSTKSNKSGLSFAKSTTSTKSRGRQKSSDDGRSRENTPSSSWGFGRLRSRSRGQTAADVKAAAAAEARETKMPSVTVTPVATTPMPGTMTPSSGPISRKVSASLEPVRPRTAGAGSAPSQRPRPQPSQPFPDLGGLTMLELLDQKLSMAAANEPNTRPASPDRSPERPRTAGPRMPGSSQKGGKFDHTIWPGLPPAQKTGAREEKEDRENQPPMPPMHRHLRSEPELSKTSSADTQSDRQSTRESEPDAFPADDIVIQTEKVLQAKKMLQARKEEAARRAEEKQRRREEQQAAAAAAAAEGREFQHRNSARWSLAPPILPFASSSANSSVPGSPAHDAEGSEWVGWEAQVKLWRQRNLEALGALSSTDEEPPKTATTTTTTTTATTTSTPGSNTPNLEERTHQGSIDDLGELSAQFPPPPPTRLAPTSPDLAASPRLSPQRSDSDGGSVLVNQRWPTQERADPRLRSVPDRTDPAPLRSHAPEQLGPPFNPSTTRLNGDERPSKHDIVRTDSAQSAATMMTNTTATTGSSWQHTHASMSSSVSSRHSEETVSLKSIQRPIAGPGATPQYQQSERPRLPGGSFSHNHVHNMSMTSSVDSTSPTSLNFPVPASGPPAPFRNRGLTASSTTSFRPGHPNNGSASSGQMPGSQADRFRAKVAAKTSAAAMMIRGHHPPGPPPAVLPPLPQSSASASSSQQKRPNPSQQQSKPLQTGPRPRAPPPTSTDPRAAPVVQDRYSGGYQYGWDRNQGFTGSAGTRTAADAQSGHRKSKQMSTDFGVDLSDVPVFVKRVQG